MFRHATHANRCAAGDPRSGAQDLHALRRRLLAGQRPRRRLPAGLPPRHGRCRVARHRHAGSLRRVRPRHYRSRGHAAGGGGIGRRLRGRVGPAHEHLRPQPGGGVRHRGAKAALPAAADQGRREGLLCRHRARRRPRHHQAQDARGARRQPLPRAWAEDLDLDGAGGRARAAAGAHHPGRAGQEADAGIVPVLHRARPASCRGARDRQDGPQGGRTPTSCSSMACRCRSRTASARRGAASSTSCTA